MNSTIQQRSMFEAFPTEKRKFIAKNVGLVDAKEIVRSTSNLKA